MCFERVKLNYTQISRAPPENADDDGGILGSSEPE
jgi:hypothetical protein